MRRKQFLSCSQRLQGIPADTVLTCSLVAFATIEPLHGVTKDPDRCASRQQGHHDTVLIDTGVLVLIAHDDRIASGQRTGHHGLMAQESCDLARHELKTLPTILPSPGCQIAREAQWLVVCQRDLRNQGIDGPDFDT